MPRFTAALRAFAEALFAGPEGPPPAARLDWLQAEVLDVVARADPGIRFLLRFCLFAVSLIAPLCVFRLGPLRRLELPLRVRALERFERGFLAGPLLILKAMLCLLYYEHPDVAREVGAADYGRLPVVTPEAHA